MSLGMDMNYICLECSTMAVRREMSHTSTCPCSTHNSQVVSVGGALSILIEERKKHRDLMLKVANLVTTLKGLIR